MSMFHPCLICAAVAEWGWMERLKRGSFTHTKILWIYICKEYTTKLGEILVDYFGGEKISLAIVERGVCAKFDGNK